MDEKQIIYFVNNSTEEKIEFFINNLIEKSKRLTTESDILSLGMIFSILAYYLTDLKSQGTLQIGPISISEI